MHVMLWIAFPCAKVRQWEGAFLGWLRGTYDFQSHAGFCFSSIVGLSVCREIHRRGFRALAHKSPHALILQCHHRRLQEFYLENRTSLRLQRSLRKWQWTRTALHPDIVYVDWCLPLRCHVQSHEQQPRGRCPIPCE